MKRLSIIIPVYNVEAYIGRCLDSCLHQDLSPDEYEIIVVNDGTPDNSVYIVEQYQLLNPHIRLVTRVNGGLSAARNTGLMEAEGEYVWFVDSDDRIEPDCLQTLVRKADEAHLDVLCFNLYIEYPDGSRDPYRVGYEKDGKVYDGKDFICRVSMPPAAWAAMYRRSFLVDNHLRFYEGILHEDQEFTPRAYCLARRIAYVHRYLYDYNQREGGIMKSNRNVKRCKDLLTVADSLYQFASEHLEPSSPSFRVMMEKVCFSLTQSLAFYSKEAFPLSEYTQKPYYPLDTSVLSGSMKCKAMLFNVSPSLYCFIYKILK